MPATTATPPTADLIALEVKTLFRTCDNFDRQKLSTYRQAGEKLVHARRLLAHGEWLPWLTRHGIPTQRASEAVRVAECWDQTPERGSLAAFLAAVPSQRTQPAAARVGIYAEPDAADDAETAWAADPRGDAEPDAAADPDPRPAGDPAYDSNQYNARDRLALLVGRCLLDAFEGGPAMLHVHYDEDYTVSIRRFDAGTADSRDVRVTRPGLLDALRAVTAVPGAALTCKGPCEKQLPAEALKDGYCRACRRIAGRR